MSADDNDIRATLGAVHNAVKGLRADVESLRESLDDIGAVAVRGARLSEVVTMAESLMDNLPNMLRGAADAILRDPSGMGILVAPHVQSLADEIADGMTAWKARRAAPPSVERA